MQSTRGPGGGYRLARDIGEINVAEVILAVKEQIDATRCKGEGDCQSGHTCLTHHLWMDLSGRLQDFLRSISLEQMIERRNEADLNGEAAQALARAQILEVALQD